MIPDTEKSTRFRDNYPLQQSLGTNDAPTMYHRQDMLDKLATLEFDSVLDIGCGVGTVLGLIEKRFPSPLLLAGFDFNEEAIDYAFRKYPEMIFTKADISERVSKLYYATVFDIILTSGVLMHCGPKLFEQAIADIISLKPKHIIHVEIQGDEKLLTERDNIFKRAHDYVGEYQKHGVSDIEVKPVSREGSELSLITVTL